MSLTTFFIWFILSFCIFSFSSLDDDGKKSIQANLDLVLDNDQLIGTYITDITTGEQGEIVVALYDLPGVKVFDEEGALMHRFGQRGRGPGDFRNLRSVSMSHGRIFALDSGPDA